MEEKRKIRIVYTVLFILAALVTGYYQYAYEKWNASWQGYNIYFCALFISPLIAVLMTVINYLIAARMGGEYSFNYKRFTPGPYLYAFMVCGCMFSTYLGVRYTEPEEDWVSSQSQVIQNDHNQFARIYQFLDFDFGSSDSDSDGGGELFFAMVIIVIIVFIFVFSYTIQHFWVVGSIAILCMMVPFLLNAWKSEKTVQRRRFKQFIH